MRGVGSPLTPADDRLRNDDRQRTVAPSSHYRLVMKRSRRLAPAAQRALDAALVVWTVAWLFAVADEVRGVADLSDTVGAVGRAVTDVGETIHGGR